MRFGTDILKTHSLFVKCVTLQILETYYGFELRQYQTLKWICVFIWGRDKTPSTFYVLVGRHALCFPVCTHCPRGKECLDLWSLQLYRFSSGLSYLETYVFVNIFLFFLFFFCKKRNTCLNSCFISFQVIINGCSQVTDIGICHLLATTPTDCAIYYSNTQVAYIASVKDRYLYSYGCPLIDRDICQIR